MIETSAHKHPLQFFDSVSIEWYCDMVETDKGCLSNHQKVMDYRYQNVFICKKCNFFMCAADAEKYQIGNKKSLGESSKSKVKNGPPCVFMPFLSRNQITLILSRI